MAGREQVLFATEVNPDLTPVLTSAPLELVLVESLPDVCSEHGLPAVESRSFAVDLNGPRSEMPTVRGFIGSMPWPWRRLSVPRGPDARVRFEYPACEYCAREVRRYRRVAQVALLAVVLTFVTLFFALRFDIEQLYLPAALAIVPGCFIELMVAVIAWSKSGYFADVWLADDSENLIVSAHPDFVTAVVRQRRTDA